MVVQVHQMVVEKVDSLGSVRYGLYGALPG